MCDVYEGGVENKSLCLLCCTVCDILEGLCITRSTSFLQLGW